MKLLLDTHLLVWYVEDSRRLPVKAGRLLDDPENELYFSAASIWELAIKSSLTKRSLGVEPRSLRRALLDNDYAELGVTGNHAVAIDLLPPLHRDPFDRLLIAQATVEGITFLTTDAIVARYPGPILKV